MNFLNTFGVNIKSLIFYTIDFLVILFVLQKFVFSKITKIMDDREKKIKESIENAKNVEDLKHEMETRYREAMKNAQAESQIIIEEAKRGADKAAQDIIEKAMKDAKDITSEYEKEMDIIREKMFATLKQDIMSLVVKTTRKILSENLTDRDMDRIVKESIKYMPSYERKQKN